MSPLREARRQSGLPAEILAERVGCTVSWLRTIERAPGLASADLLARLAAALGVPPAALLAGLARHRLPVIY